ncbi:DUF397 domain-containing protein [Solwaraspora sp. WMMD406]|uniref:DUF397 domain-containing protein n=1 Tax=Solwaraspora sp. WMMD406 TaxID=3016095 RepID=UPI002415A52A|nr:DUF397 domain-containing protein [Solwaraspora sp. WMMD406]MDG4764114.1 DUF397 domain-containing protein [Solwaraspora sp. WMMD406]
MSSRDEGGPVPDSRQPTRWRKSGRSGPGECVEVAQTDRHVYVRDSKTRDHTLRFDHERWLTFVKSL